MASDRLIGALLIIVSVVVVIVYGWLVFAPPDIKVLGDKIDIFVLKLTGFIAIAGIFGILGWIGYTLATTPPPKPIEEIEKELEEELKKIEKEISEEKQGEGSPSSNEPAKTK
ncbi:MAG: transcriptional regulator [Pyrodictiaceae archaeon]